MKHLIYIGLVFLITISLTGCLSSEKEEKSDEKILIEATGNEKPFGEDRRIYKYDKEDGVINLYITVLSEKETGKNTPSFFDLNHWYDMNPISTDSPKLDVIIQEGNENGPQKNSFGYGTNKANASIQIRGNTNRLGNQKSYKIKLEDQAGLWLGQNTINLNKHQFDFTRVRNKLSFDYFKLIPNLTSLRTNFVRLYVKDLTSEPRNQHFEDFGLYTQIEQPNKRFLSSHGLDPNGHLYKATEFSFYKNPEQLKPENDPAFDEEQFESILEIKGSNDHEKLLSMLKDVNDYSVNINDIIEKHFDRDNYLTWLAVNILLGNHDTVTQNFYLYSPLNSSTWYFLPWDYDGAWDWEKQQQNMSAVTWEEGVSNYWGVVLHKRFLKDQRNVDELSQKIESLSKIITPSQTKEFLDHYYKIVHPYVSSSPDSDFLPIKIDQYKKYYYEMIHVPEKNKEKYYVNIQKPMPIFLQAHTTSNKVTVFEWEAAYDLQGDNVTYTFQLSKEPSFKKIVVEKKDIIDLNTTVSNLPKGIYYWKVISRDQYDHEQVAFDMYEDEEGQLFYGVQELIVN
ncbi:CotH kinase family protein [Peribacillus acanthi]|uniref:CotH kinase family protein n=1 Tax=Peribacillus acanthi TaxID=2171554 RepID=UPI000D3E2EA7|nr:CotH kinase family protein [Peribacillus acanthi]